jgi:hypothetical protein
MIIRYFYAITGFLIALMVVISPNWTAASADSIEVPRISIEQAKQMLGSPDVVFIDVRTPKSWWRSATKIAHAVRKAPSAVKQWVPEYAGNKTLIFYCA